MKKLTDKIEAIRKVKMPETYVRPFRCSDDYRRCSDDYRPASDDRNHELGNRSTSGADFGDGFGTCDVKLCPTSDCRCHRG